MTSDDNHPIEEDNALSGEEERYPSGFGSDPFADLDLDWLASEPAEAGVEDTSPTAPAAEQAAPAATTPPPEPAAPEMEAGFLDWLYAAENVERPYRAPATTRPAASPIEFPAWLAAEDAEVASPRPWLSPEEQMRQIDDLTPHWQQKESKP